MKKYFTVMGIISSDIFPRNNYFSYKTIKYISILHIKETIIYRTTAGIVKKIDTTTKLKLIRQSIIKP